MIKLRTSISWTEKEQEEEEVEDGDDQWCGRVGVGAQGSHVPEGVIQLVQWGGYSQSPIAVPLPITHR